MIDVAERVETQLKNWKHGHTYVGFRTQKDREAIEAYCLKQGYEFEYYRDPGNGFEMPPSDLLHIVADRAKMVAREAEWDRARKAYESKPVRGSY